MKHVVSALRSVYTKPYAWVVTFFTFATVLFIYYIIFLQTTTWTRFWTTDIPIYVWSQILLSIANALLIGIAMSLFLAVFEIKQKSKQATLLTAGSFLFSAAATGCPVCGAFLLPLLGVSASLAALPLGGIEVKILSLLVLLYAIYEYSKTFTGACPVRKDKLLSWKNGRPAVNINRHTLASQKPLAVLILFIVLVYSLPFLPKTWRVNFQNTGLSLNQPLTNATMQAAINEKAIKEQMNPKEGYQLNVSYGTLGPQLIQIGTINPAKFAAVFEAYHETITPEEEAILTKGSDAPIRITAANAHFLLDFFWAVGLTNASPILTKGPMMQYGVNQLGSFASTGNWVIGNADAMQYYAKETIIPLTAQQEALVENVAAHVYRPCCANSALFPDCNHGMAMLGMLELMASSGATADEMYQAAKYVNAYWFPLEYYQLAVYFKKTKGLDFQHIDPKVLLSKDYSSVFGIQNVQRFLQDNNIQLTPPEDTVGCGV